jgi:predicted RNA-binding Zn-ribbon protein involved in translation (DUF1610 family)
MSDLIDRQEAIDRFNVIRPVDPKKDEYTKGIDVGIAMCIVAVKDQPTIQPEKAQLSQEGATFDLIDRQAAIGAIAQCTNCGNEDTLRKYVLKHNLDNSWSGGILEALNAVKDLPTAQSEKAQLSPEDTTPDMISRMETVEHLRRVIDATVPITDYDSGYVDGVEFGISTVSTMPTIQPQSTAGQLNDGAQSTAQSTNLIDRQATIDAVNNAFDRETLLTGFVRSIAVRAIRDMPSAQPEPQEGHWIEGKIYRDVIECYCSECGQLMTTAATVRMNYCPNCGAKMTIAVQRF